MTQADKMHESGYVLVSEAAERAVVTVYTIYRWIKAGKVEAVQLAGKWYVNWQSMIRFLTPAGAKLLGIDPKTTR